MNIVRRLLAAAALLSLLLCLPLPAAAQSDFSGRTLEEVMEQFRSDYGLNEQNFSLCYYDTVTGEEYRYNDGCFMVAASTFKLPLNLYYYELEQSGQLSPDSPVGGMRLADAHYQSLVWSNNDVSIAMLYNLGSFRTYKELMRKYFTMEDSQITSAYYADNNYCTAMMLDALRYLYERRDQFDEMIGYMKQAQPGQYFARYLDGYEVAHKYGYYVDDDKGVTAVNDVGIVFTPQPFLLAVYTANAPGGEEVVARACQLLTEYSVWQYEQAQAAAAEQEPEAEPAQQEPAEDSVQPEQPAQDPVPELPAPEGPPPQEDGAQAEPPAAQMRQDTLWWIILAGAVVFLAADLLVLFRMRRRVKRR